MPTNAVQPHWANILHVGLGGDNNAYGDRSPAIFFRATDARLFISSAVNGKKSYGSTSMDDTTPIPINKWTRVEVSQIRQPYGAYQFTIRIGGIIHTQLENTDAREFSPAYLHTSSPTAEAKMANLLMETFPTTRE